MVATGQRRPIPAIPPLPEGSGRSVQCQHHLQCVVNRLHFRTAESTGEVTQPGLWVDDGELFDHHASPGAVDLDLGTGGRFSSPGRRRCDDPGGERKVVGLDHNGILRSELFVPTGIARSSETVEVTTHERQPSLRPVPPVPVWLRPRDVILDLQYGQVGATLPEPVGGRRVGGLVTGSGTTRAESRPTPGCLVTAIHHVVAAVPRRGVGCGELHRVGSDSTECNPGVGGD